MAIKDIISSKIKVFKMRRFWNQDVYLRRLLKRRSRPSLHFENSYRVLKVIVALEFSHD